MNSEKCTSPSAVGALDEHGEPLETRDPEAAAVLQEIARAGWEDRVDPDHFAKLMLDFDHRLAVLENWARQVYPRR